MKILKSKIAGNEQRNQISFVNIFRVDILACILFRDQVNLCPRGPLEKISGTHLVHTTTKRHTHTHNRTPARFMLLASSFGHFA